MRHDGSRLEIIHENSHFLKFTRATHPLSCLEDLRPSSIFPEWHATSNVASLTQAPEKPTTACNTRNLPPKRTIIHGLGEVRHHGSRAVFGPEPAARMTAFLFWKPTVVVTFYTLARAAQPFTIPQETREVHAPGSCVAQSVKWQKCLIRVHWAAGAAASLPRRDTLNSNAVRSQPQHVLRDS